MPGSREQKEQLLSDVSILFDNASGRKSLQTSIVLIQWLSRLPFLGNILSAIFNTTMAVEQLFYDFVNMFFASLFTIGCSESVKYYLKKYWELKVKSASRRNSVQPVRYNNYIGPPRAGCSRPQQWTPAPASNDQPIRLFFPATNDYLLSIPELQQGRRCAPPAYSKQ